MARRPAPNYAPLEPTPLTLAPEELCADGALTIKGAAAFLGERRDGEKTHPGAETDQFQVRGPTGDSQTRMRLATC
jgi:hypothetical protein